jgi:aspartyl-tRNA(Asn)/glutamyl-tRNA(Gln) amidotransferase subunit B
MPVLNEKAVEYTVRTGLALNCEISRYSKWDRKNYFYPDLPKAWQTSQYDLPLCKGGFVEYELDGKIKTVRINRIHLEEDAGKLLHEGGVSRIDYNRSGVPLMEIVTEPDLHSEAEAVAFLDGLKSVLKYIGVSDVKMQEGSLRCDVNLSVAKPGQKLGTRTETKNLNSFSAVKRSILFEYDRQCGVLNAGGTITQETRRWDDNKSVGYSMRGKEDAHDYRYFPEPDLMPVVLSGEKIEEIRKAIPRLKKERIAIYTEKLGLPLYDARILTADKDIADLFEGTAAVFKNPKKASNYIMSEIMRKGKREGSEDVEIGVSPAALAEILTLIDSGVISLAASKDVLDAVWNGAESPLAAVERLGLRQNSDSGELESAVKEVIAANASAAEQYKAGNQKVAAFLVGQVMKATKGKSNPKLVGELIEKLLKTN